MKLNNYFYIRRLDTGQEVPDDVQNYRNELRKKHEDLINDFRKVRD